MDSMTMTILSHPYQILMAAFVLGHATRALVAALRELGSDRPAKLPIETHPHAA
jgi:hypothetical protein